VTLFNIVDKKRHGGEIIFGVIFFMVIAKPFGIDKIIIPYNRDPFFISVLGLRGQTS